MKTSSNWSGTFLAALLVVGCSKGPTSPEPVSAATQKGPEGGGTVSGLAAADVKNGSIDIDLVAVAQTDGVPAFYANSGGEYLVRPGRATEIYVQMWTSNPAVAEAPRMIVDWGDGERGNIHCGPCRLSRTYRTEGRYTVKVIMDDRAGGVTSRTFVLDVALDEPDEPAEPAPTPTPCAYSHGLPGWCPAAKVFCEEVPIDSLSSSHAQDACQACYGAPCVSEVDALYGNAWVGNGIGAFYYSYASINVRCDEGGSYYLWKHKPADVEDRSTSRCGGGFW